MLLILTKIWQFGTKILQVFQNCSRRPNPITGEWSFGLSGAKALWKMWIYEGGGGGGGGSSHFIIGLKPSPPLIPHHKLGTPLVWKGTEAQSPITDNHNGIFGYPRALCAPEISSPGITLARDTPHLQKNAFKARNKTEQWKGEST